MAIELEINSPVPHAVHALLLSVKDWPFVFVIDYVVQISGNGVVESQPGLTSLLEFKLI
jgi:hypothetical protein